MTVLVTGTPDSGKSRYAEKLVLDMCGHAGNPSTRDASSHELYYIATMRVVDEKSEARVRKHRQMRDGKGFVTLEIPYRVDRALKQISDPGHAVVLLECISNLAGNEMHDNPGRAFADSGLSEDVWLKKTAADIVSDIRVLADACKDMVIVANRFEPDDAGYDDMTRLYVGLNNLLVDELSLTADRVAGPEEIREVESGS